MHVRIGGERIYKYDDDDYSVDDDDSEILPSRIITRGQSAGVDRVSDDGVSSPHVETMKQKAQWAVPCGKHARGAPCGALSKAVLLHRFAQSVALPSCSVSLRHRAPAAVHVSRHEHGAAVHPLMFVLLLQVTACLQLCKWAIATRTRCGAVPSLPAAGGVDTSLAAASAGGVTIFAFAASDRRFVAATCSSNTVLHDSDPEAGPSEAGIS